ncbi:MAG: DinB family protein [Chloroflexi bacterium]|nr:MAG: DinB family protein [Chloroflexota bacterium]
MNADTILRQQLLDLLRGSQAHMSLDHAVADFPVMYFNAHPPNVTYTFWHLLEHLRFAQWDILDYIRNPDYQWSSWPIDYWPAPDAQADETQWNETLRRFREDLRALEVMVENPTIDLTAPLPYAPQHTYLREILLVADHNAYHIGEFAILRQVMGLWPPGAT